MIEEHMKEDALNSESTDDVEEIESSPEEMLKADEETQSEQLSNEELRSIIEVLLLVSDRPLPVKKIQEVVEGIGAKQVHEIIIQIRERLRENDFPYQVREVGGGFVLSSLPEFAPWIRKLYSPKAKASKLSQAALETLAVIAYKQPVTRGEIEAIRGVNVDSTLKTLLEKRLCEIVGYKDVIGKPATYGTTSEFLLHFGLSNLADLPSIDELRSSETQS
jgi:segregation and condensation protein B